jgi:hypothetical protein
MPFPAVLNLSSPNGTNGLPSYDFSPHEFAGISVAAVWLDGHCPRPRRIVCYCRSCVANRLVLDLQSRVPGALS